MLILYLRAVDGDWHHVTSSYLTWTGEYIGRVEVHLSEVKIRKSNESTVMLHLV